MQLLRGALRGPIRPPSAAAIRPNMSSSAFTKAGDLLGTAPRLPKVLVLDLDYTLWPFWCEMFSPQDAPHSARLYPEAEEIIDACKQHGILVTAASRTPTPDVARAFMQRLGLDRKFDSIQLIPAADGYDTHSAQKDTCHLPNIKKATGCDYSEMLFFDDEGGNVRKVSRLGVCSILVPTSIGLCLKTFEQGLAEYAKGS